MKGSVPAGLACCLLLAAGACGGGHRTGRAVHSTAWPSRAELRWLRQIGDWRATLDPYGGLDTRRGRALARCPVRFAVEVGRPPTARLRPAFADFRAGCRLLGTLGRSYLRNPGSMSVFGQYTNAAGNLLRRSSNLFSQAIRESTVGGDRRLPARTDVRSSTTSYADPGLAAAIEPISRERVTVRCWSPPDWAHLTAELDALDIGRREQQQIIGRAYREARLVELRAAVCSDLADMRAHHGVGSVDEVFRWGEAVKVLAHEATHIRGVDDEADTECYAMQRVASTARRLGMTGAVPRTLARVVWENYDLMPSGYRTSICVDGGPFDLHPASTQWP